ncbi:MAG: hypothetical protein FJW31_02050 [Acidobacteria bacterium]|nr:hypothetical protein [Acidobacteriota bacterium]
MWLLTACGGSKPDAEAGPAAPAAAQPKAGAGNKPRDLETYMVLVDLDAYEKKVAPAFEKYVTSGDTEALAELTSAAIPTLPDRKQRTEAALKLAPAVVEAKCLVKLPGIEPFQLGPGELISYLYSASDLIRDTLAARDISDVTLDYPLGEHTEIIRAADAAELRVNVRNVPVPEDAGITKQLADLLKLMDDSAQNPRHALAMVMK